MADYGDVRDMACTLSEIERWVREICGDASLRAGADAIVIPLDGFDLTLSVQPLPPRRLGLVVFRLSRVSFSYPPQRQADARAWIRRFDHHTQRGGG